MALLTNQWTPHNYKDANRQRIYLKDIDCPKIWEDKVRELVPLGLFYLNDTTGDIGGVGAVDEADPQRPGMRKGRGVAKAGDLMSSLPPEMRAENLMCYIGHEGTYTPAHKEMCASLGHNLMVETSTGAVEDGKPTKPGSSVWFMTESKEREVVSEYWLSTLGHDIEVENHFAQINAWKAAPFKTYVVEQNVGDFILIPPLAPHQVWNRGTRTMKVAWNRTTVETLEMAVNEALPNIKMVCRDEQYKNKAIIYYTLNKYSKLLKATEKYKQRQKKQELGAKIRQLEKDFRRLQALYSQILVSESFFSHQAEKKLQLVPFDGNITCSYCRCNVFNRFLTCPSCVGDLGNSEEDTYDICMECYAMGRSCACISKLKWVEQFPWGELTQKHEQWRHQIIQFEGQITDKSPKSLKAELEKLGKKRTLAQICQLELIKRPWRDIRKPIEPVDGEESEDAQVDANGTLKKKKRKVRRSEKFLRDHSACHVDKGFEPKWKQAQCTTCDQCFCYGTLFRGYDMMPQDIMADPSWRCPKCLNICNCRICRTKPGYQPYIPNGTRLGHNTRIIADPRSAESLVDFSYSNLSWIQKADDDNHPTETRRLKKRIRAADKAKSKETELGDDYVGGNADADNNVENSLLHLAQHEGIPIDPSLASLGAGAGPEEDDEDDEDVLNENPEEFTRASVYATATPLAPQYVVPAGGVIRNKEQAYEQSEMITYDYPDPEMAQPVPAIPDTTTNGGIVAPPGYEAAVPTSPSRIEMVERKRKRGKLDDGERPFNPRKGKAKPKPKESKVVTLSVAKENLADLNQMAIIAQSALNGVDGPVAPVIGSDLNALNSYSGVQGEALRKKKVRIEEEQATEEDDEYRGSKYRDRRKSGPDGPPEPMPEPERRTTRKQAVTYEDPFDDEDLLEEVSDTETSKAHPQHGNKMPRLGPKPASKTLETNDDDMDTDEPRANGQTNGNEKSNGSLTIRRFADFNEENPSEDTDGPPPQMPKPQTVNAHAAAQKKTGTAKVSPVKKRVSAVSATAEANRKAKLALEQESSEDWSDDDSLMNDSAPTARHPGRPSASKAGPSQPVASAADWGDESSEDERPPRGQSFTSVNKGARVSVGGSGRRT